MAMGLFADLDGLAIAYMAEADSLVGPDGRFRDDLAITQSGCGGDVAVGGHPEAMTRILISSSVRRDGRPDARAIGGPGRCLR
jgi:hypothetical protein